MLKLFSGSQRDTHKPTSSCYESSQAAITLRDGEATMAEQPAVPLRGITNAAPTTDGMTIVFQLEAESGNRQTVACAVGATTQMEATLTAALKKAETARGETDPFQAGKFRLTSAIPTPQTAVGHEYGAVIFSLFPLKNLPLHLALTPADSRRLSRQLLDAASRAEERPAKPI
jgi:hypothetical protein